MKLYPLHRHLCFLLAALLGATFLGAVSAHATTRTVNTTLDHIGACEALSATTDCTLREAINASVAGDTVTFAVSGPIVLTLGELGIGRSLNIVGPAQGSLTVQRNGGIVVFRIFNVTAGTVGISNLTISNGYVIGTPGVAGDAANANGGDGGVARGGGILNAGTLTLTNCTISDNIAQGGTGGAGYAGSGGNGGTAGDSFGGGISNTDLGSLTLINCTVSGNLAQGGDGGASDSGGLSGNGGLAVGGAIANENGLVMVNSTLADNMAQGGNGGDSASATEGTGGNGGFAAGGAATTFFLGMGGPIAVSRSLAATNCTLAGNVAKGGDGGKGGTGDSGGDGGSGVSGGLATDRNDETSVISLHNTIIALNTVAGGAGGPGGTSGTPGNPPDSPFPTGIDVLGDVTSQGHNWIGISDGSDGWIASDLLGTLTTPLDPQLGALANNGGPTPTRLLLPGSAAIDAGDDAVLGAPLNLTTDQRGLPRKIDDPASVGVHVDIGATEFDPAQGGATFVVNSLDDHSDGTCGVTDCTLREAVFRANANADTNTITFKPGLTGQILLITRVLPLNEPVNINGPGAALLRLSGNNSHQVFIIAAGKTVNLSGLTIVDGTQFMGQTGAVTNSGTLTVADCVFSNNTALQSGGALYNEGTLTVRDCTFSGNTAFSGGALHNTGGVTATLSGCTFSGNTAAYGAGVLNEGTLAATNCTLSGNTATDSGGGVMNNGGTLTVRNCTITGNAVIHSSPDYGGGGIEDQGATGPHIASSIIAGNSSPTGPDLHGGFVSDGFNVIGKKNDATGFTNAVKHDLVGTNTAPKEARLGPLQNNGGPTRTHALLSNSPAIDAGKAFGTTTDQRGQVRPHDDAALANASDGSDSGAYERQSPTLTINDVTVTEGDSGTLQATFQVKLLDGPSQTVSVHYATSNGTALAGSDYTTVPDTVLTFAAGQTSKLITVPIIGDTRDEPNETFKVSLSGAVNATISDSLGVGTITDNDPTPRFFIDDVTVTEANSGTINAVFHLTLSAASGRSVTVTYKTADGTATAGSDYVAHPSTTLTFTPGQTAKTITVAVKGDALDEGNETFKVVLQSASFASIVDDKGVGTITDNDPLPSLKISDAPALAEGALGTTHNALFTVTLTPASGRTVTVNYATANGTATAGSDYTAASGTLTFSPGQTSKTLPIQVLGDATVEPDESFKVNLSGASFATITDSQGVHTITNDDASE